MGGKRNVEPHERILSPSSSSNSLPDSEIECASPNLSCRRRPPHTHYLSFAYFLLTVTVLLTEMNSFAFPGTFLSAYLHQGLKILGWVIFIGKLKD